MSITKKVIPNPAEVPDKHHDKVLAHVAEQFGLQPIPGETGHYGVEKGSVLITPLEPGRDQVTFVRTNDPSVPAAPHGLDLS